MNARVPVKRLPTVMLNGVKNNLTSSATPLSLFRMKGTSHLRRELSLLQRIPPHCGWTKSISHHCSETLRFLIRFSHLNTNHGLFHGFQMWCDKRISPPHGLELEQSVPLFLSIKLGATTWGPPSVHANGQRKAGTLAENWNGPWVGALGVLAMRITGHPP